MRLITHEQQRAAIAQLKALFAERAQREASLQSREAELASATQRAFDEQTTLARHQFAARQSVLDRQYKEDREAIFRQYETAGFKLALEEERSVAQAEQEHAEQREAGKALCQHQCQKIQHAYKAESVKPRAEYVQSNPQTSAIRAAAAFVEFASRRIGTPAPE